MLAIEPSIEERRKRHQQFLRELAPYNYNIGKILEIGEMEGVIKNDGHITIVYSERTSKLLKEAERIRQDFIQSCYPEYITK